MFRAYRSVSIAVITLFLVFASRLVLATGYNVIDLGSFNATSANNHGQVVGNGPYGVLWSGGIVTDLPPFIQPVNGGVNGNFWGGTAYNINDSGQILSRGLYGIAGPCFPGGQGRSVVIRDGALLCGLSNSSDEPGAINASGLAVINSLDGTRFSPPQATYWDTVTNSGGGRVGNDPEGLPNYAYDINDLGKVVGWYLPDWSSPLRAALIGQVNDLGTLGGQTSQARAINNVDQIVGFSETASGETHGFLWQSGAMSDIGPFIGSKLDINGAGKIVGSQMINGAPSAVLWESGVTTDLNGLIPSGTGWLLESAVKINESGLIVGNGKLNGQSRAFMLIPDTLTQQSANLTLTITPSQDPYISGPFYFDVTVMNNGPDLARSVAVIPSAVWGARATPSQGSCFENAWTDFYTSSPIAYSWCALGDLASGASATVRVSPGDLSLTASTFAIELDTDTADNRVTRTVNRATADLSLSLADSPDPVLVGQALTYTASIVNFGPDKAGTVSFWSNTPAGVTHLSASASQGSCSGTTSIRCDLGDIPSGATVTVTMVDRPMSAGTISRGASVPAFSTTDPNFNNNTASASTTVNPAADLTLTMTDSPDPVKKRRNLTYAINVANNGPNAANGVTITDILPPDIIFVSATPSQGSCSGTATVTCNLGNLASGGNANVTIVIKPKSPGTISNSATASASETDPNSGNNSATTSTTVTK